MSVPAAAPRYEISLLKAIAMCIMLAFIQLVAGIFFKLIKTSIPEALSSLMFFLAAVLSIVLIIYLLGGKDSTVIDRFHPHFLRQLKAKQVGLTLGVAMAAAIFNSQFIDDLIRWFPQLHTENPGLAEAMGDNAILILVFVALVVPVFEEAFFRGLLLPGLDQKYGIAAAVAINSCLFALIHGNPPQIISVLVIGPAINILMLKTRNIYYPVIFHCMFNFSIIVAAALGPAFNTRVVVFAALAVLVGGTVMLYRIKTPFSGSLPAGGDPKPEDNN